MTLEIEGEVPPALYAKLARAPVSTVRWIHRSKLKPNDYNPNRVARPELELLIISILEDGFTQPLVMLPDYTLVDGFHRWNVSGDKRLHAIYQGYCPVVVVDADSVHRKMSTIRHNRARGVHTVLPMAEIVRAMLDEGVSAEDICARVGMDREEVARLSNRAGMPERMKERGAVAFGREQVPSRDAP
jgi:ParB-like chromosome segregation protein Spo0J